MRWKVLLEKASKDGDKDVKWKYVAHQVFNGFAEATIRIKGLNPVATSNGGPVAFMGQLIVIWDGEWENTLTITAIEGWVNGTLSITTEDFNG